MGRWMRGKRKAQAFAAAMCLAVGMGVADAATENVANGETKPYTGPLDFWGPEGGEDEGDIKGLIKEDTQLIVAQGGTANFDGARVEWNRNGNPVAIENSGTISTNCSFETEFFGKIVNHSGGTIHFNDTISKLNGALVNDAGGEVNITGGFQMQALASPWNAEENGVTADPDDIYAIDNSGRLTIKTDENKRQYITDNIRHNAGAVTDITLNAPNAMLMGDIEGGADAGFSLTLQNGAVWVTTGSDQSANRVTLGEGSEITTMQAMLNRPDFAEYVQKFEYGNDDGDTPEETAAAWKKDLETRLEYAQGNAPARARAAARAADSLNDHVLHLPNFKGEGGTISVASKLADGQSEKIDFGGSGSGTFNLAQYDAGSGAALEGSELPKTEVLQNAQNVSATNRIIASDGKTYEQSLIQDEDGTYFLPAGKGSDVLKLLGSQPVQRPHEDGKVINGADLDNVFRRLNDLRANPDDAGPWVRGGRDRTNVNDRKYNTSTIGGGYDWGMQSDTSRFYCGVGVGYTSTDAETGAIGNGQATSYQLYGSWMGKKNNDYLDCVVKYGRLRKDYSGLNELQTPTSGRFRKDLTAVALKYGRRIKMKGSFYLEPQLGYTYGSVGSADYMENDRTRIRAGRMNSHIFSAGLQAGQRVKDTEFYGRLAYVYDTDGKMDVSAYGKTVTDDMGGGFVRAAIGVAHKIDDANCLYLDIGRDFGNTIERPYSFNLGFSCTF